jgi:hypothetical protein
MPLRLRAGTNLGSAGQYVGIRFTENTGAAAVGEIRSVAEDSSHLGFGFFGYNGGSLLESLHLSGGGNATVAGSVTTVGGIVCGSPTGGNLGVGKINAVEVRANNVVLTSDANLKTDVEPLPAALPLVAAIEPKSFKWLPLPELDPVEGPDGEMVAQPAGPAAFTERSNRGFLVQDVVAAIGGEVEDGVDLGSLVAILWQAVRELQDEVNALKEPDKPSPVGRRAVNRH